MSESGLYISIFTFWLINLMSNFPQNALTDVWKKCSSLAFYSAAIQGQWSKVEKLFLNREN